MSFAGARLLQLATVEVDVALDAVDRDGLTGLDPRRAVYRSDNSRDVELAGDDGAVAHHATDIGDDRARDTKHRHPRRQGHLADHDLAVLQIAGLVERAHDPSDSTVDTGRPSHTVDHI